MNQTASSTKNTLTYCSYTTIHGRNTLANTLALLSAEPDSLQFLRNNMIHVFDMAEIDHEDTLYPIPQVKALLCHVVVAVVVSAGVLV